YRTVLSSIRELGFFVPMAVFRRADGKFDVLNGNVRLVAAKELGLAQIPCLVSKDDEAYTFNTKVSRVVPVQANRMIVKAIEKGVPADRLARTLGISQDTVTRLQNLLEGVCPEAIELLKDKPVAAGVFRELRRVTPLRQMEIADTLNSGARYKTSVARLMAESTDDDQLSDAERERRATQVIHKPEDVARLERELQSVEKEHKRAEKNYCRLSCEFTLARDYLAMLLRNNKVLKFLAQHYKDELDTFQRIEQSSAAA
ncbi:MAG: plasmid partitioning protein RepB C-terminal domain-containing protein, partial [Polyangiaceae bacterium]